MSGAGTDDAARPTKRRRSSASSSGGRRDAPPPEPSHSRPSTPSYSEQGRGPVSVSAGEDELESEGELGETGAWHYTLEVIQQPQRARACGFGDKDRRPLSPPPIIRLWVRTSSGRLVDPTHVSIHYLVLMVDLWSADGTQERNVVMHPNSQPARRRASEQTDYASSSRPNTATSRPATGHGLGMIPGPTFSSAWRMAAEAQPGPTSPGTSPLSRLSAGEGQVPPPLPVPGWQDRPGMGRANSYNPSYFDLEPAPPRPVTAPAQQRPRGVPSLTLPSLSSLTARPAPETGHLTLPAMQARASVGSSSSSQHRVSWSTESSRPSLGDVIPPRPSTGSWGDRPRTAGGMSSRPSTGGTLLSPHHEHPYASSESSYGFPPTPEATRMQLLPAANYSRVLVGSVTANCQRLKDEQGQTGLFFFTHDLGIRTEGVFALRFKLTNVASLMTASVMPQDCAGMLAEVYSEPFTVYSAKRFPGVIPTTDLTRVFANQNVRLPTRKRRARDSPQPPEKEEGG